MTVFTPFRGNLAIFRCFLMTLSSETISSGAILETEFLNIASGKLPWKWVISFNDSCIYVYVYAYVYVYNIYIYIYMYYVYIYICIHTGKAMLNYPVPA